ncbi:MAG: hypothetical protein JNG86_22980 [Verrucomicrobiaceae bacterium]|nr:hypothetical protein [Verrucomicrobiaceae bacterium]
MKTALRIAALATSISLLIGCVWLAQRKSEPAMLPSSKSGPLPAPTIMPGSKSFGDLKSISVDALQIQTPPRKP